MIRKKKDMVTPYGTVTQCTDVPWYRYPLSYYTNKTNQYTEKTSNNKDIDAFS